MYIKNQCEIKIDEDGEDLNHKLLECYGFPLLNFAFIIADVLIGNSVFSDKFYFGRNIKSIRKGTNELKELKERVFDILEDYSLNYEHPLVSNILKKQSDEVLKAIIIENFNLKSFLQKLESRIQQSEFILNIRKTHPVESRIFWPIFKKNRKLDLGKNNQVAFLWAQAINKGGAHWQNISNLFAWFLEFLEESNYAKYLHFKRVRKDEDWIGFEENEKEDEISPNYKVLKVRYSQIKKEYRYLLESTSKLLYFRKKNEKPEKPICFFHPVISVEFYKNKIRTIYQVGDNLSSRDVTFQDNIIEQEIKEYDEKIEQKEMDGLLLKVE